ncbi:F-box protein At3g07870-like [Apium graveolens]|uniref:F-box protein At3g07870-like n=1 Tax=Apium graveolens TaxID=4045 RepID=UPI003D78D916
MASSIESLPPGILAYILSRTPVKTIVYSKCVCKKWRSLLSEPYFVDLHLSRSHTCLVIHQEGSLSKCNIFKLGELEDKPDSFNIYHDPVMKIKFGLGFRYSVMHLSGTINGLTCIWHYSGSDETYICNPVTREYTLLPEHKIIRKPLPAVSYGFGFIAARNQYKVVRFYQGGYPLNQDLYKSDCEVYTLGTGMWRSLGQVPVGLGGCQNGVFLNGNLHWLAHDQHHITSDLVCTFDLEREFSELAASAPLVDENMNSAFRSLGVLGGCLCLCDNTSECEFVIWVRQDYGMKECWTKEIVIENDFETQLYKTVHVLTVLTGGSILMVVHNGHMFTYHRESKTLQRLDISWTKDFSICNVMVYVPSFIRLKSFMSERVLIF